jgi:signal transduction histidine kinase
LLEIPEEELNEELLEYREIAQRGCIRLMDLIDNLLDSSRLDSKRIELRIRKENLVELIKKYVIDMMCWVNDRKHTLATDLPKELFFEIDKLRFSQALTNIISNAIKNTPLGGKILVKINETTEYIDIQVKDTGVGLTDKEKERIFQKFGKIERYGKDLGVDIEGVGLGLYISKEIIELHGGQILVESEGRNKGATFTIRLFKKEISEN